MEIVNIDEIQKGDILLISGFEYENQICVVTVDEVTEDGLIVPVEMGGLDYCPEDSEQIIRIGSIGNTPVLTILAQNMHLALSKDWNKQLQK